MKKIIASTLFLVLAMSAIGFAAAADKATGDVGYTIGIQRYLSFDVHEATAKQPMGGTLHYSDVQNVWYTVDVQLVRIEGSWAWLAGPVVEGNAGLGQWLYAVVYDGGTPGSAGDVVWGDFYLTQDAAKAAFDAKEDPASTAAVTSGNLVVHSADSEPGAPDICTKIQSGTLLDSVGNPIALGFDQYGYNYQAHMFLGYYDNALRPAVPVDTGDTLVMKWNDAWLSNGDCNGDGKLDRPASYIGSGAWETNHMWGTYEQDGKTCTWDYFVKIVAVPSDAVPIGGIWYTASGTEIGPDIWGQFAIVQEVSNDLCAGQNGLLDKSSAGPGFGKY